MICVRATKLASESSLLSASVAFRQFDQVVAAQLAEDRVGRFAHRYEVIASAGFQDDITIFQRRAKCQRQHLLAVLRLGGVRFVIDSFVGGVCLFAGLRFDQLPILHFHHDARLSQAIVVQRG